MPTSLETGTAMVSLYLRRAVAIMRPSLEQFPEGCKNMDACISDFITILYNIHREHFFLTFHQ